MDGNGDANAFAFQVRRLDGLEVLEADRADADHKYEQEVTVAIVLDVLPLRLCCGEYLISRGYLRSLPVIVL